MISLAAKGLTTGEISAHLADVYGAEGSRDTISWITDAVIEELTAWQSRPLESVYDSAPAAPGRCHDQSPLPNPACG